MVLQMALWLPQSFTLGLFPILASEPDPHVLPSHHLVSEKMPSLGSDLNLSCFLRFLPGLLRENGPEFISARESLGPPPCSASVSIIGTRQVTAQQTSTPPPIEQAWTSFWLKACHFLRLGP